MIAVVTPTMASRLDIYNQFLDAWQPLFEWHDVQLVTVFDGEEPEIVAQGTKLIVSDMMCDHAHLVYNRNDGVRNAGFYYVARHMPQVEIVITLDDDVLPMGDTIGCHLHALGQRVPVSWMSTASEYMRGFPYGVRDEAEVVLSHGVWHGVADWDAPTQLVMGNREVTFYKGPVPRGVYYPMCGMNLAFKRKMLPYMYFAPMGPRVGLDRFADIWCGITSKRIIDCRGWAVVTGYAEVQHNRASNVWRNLQKEARGLELNEDFWMEGEMDHPYFKEYENQRAQWRQIMRGFLGL